MVAGGKAHMKGGSQLGAGGCSLRPTLVGQEQPEPHRGRPADAAPEDARHRAHHEQSHESVDAPRHVVVGDIAREALARWPARGARPRRRRASRPRNRAARRSVPDPWPASLAESNGPVKPPLPCAGAPRHDPAAVPARSASDPLRPRRDAGGHGPATHRGVARRVRGGGHPGRPRAGRRAHRQRRSPPGARGRRRRRPDARPGRRVERLDRACRRAPRGGQHGSPPLPGAAALLGELDRQPDPWAIATSSRAEQVRTLGGGAAPACAAPSSSTAATSARQAGA